MANEGRPRISFRIHPDALAMLEERAERALPGRRGGVGAYIRRVLYEHLDFDSAEHPAIEGGEQAE